MATPTSSSSKPSSLTDFVLFALHHKDASKYGDITSVTSEMSVILNLESSKLSASPSKYTSAAKKHLVVKIVRASGLAAKGENGSSNPYCTVIYGDTTKRTSTIKGKLNPEFNSKLEYELHESRASPLEISVWNENISKGGKVQEPNFLGMIALSPEEIRDSKTDMTFELQKRSSRSTVSGTITIRLNITTQSGIIAPDSVDMSVDQAPFYSQLVHLLFSRDISLRNYDFYDVTDNPDAFYGPSEITTTMLELYKGVFKIKSSKWDLDYFQEMMKIRSAKQDYDFLQAVLPQAACFLCYMGRGALNDILKDKTLLADYSKAASVLIASILSILKRYKYNFPVIQEVVTKRLDLTLYVLSLCSYFSGSSEDAFRKTLVKTLTESKEHVYTLMNATAEVGDTQSEIERLNKLVDLVIVEMHEDEKFYGPYFETLMKVNVKELNGKTIFAWFYEECSSMFTRLQLKGTEQEIVFALYVKTSKMGEKYSYPKSSVEQLFGPLVRKGIENMCKQTILYSTRAMEADSLQPISDRVLNSSAVVDVLSIFSQNMETMASLSWDDKKALEYYCNLMTESIMRDVGAFSKWLRSKCVVTEAVVEFEVTVELCVALNNIAQMTEGLNLLKENMKKLNGGMLTNEINLDFKKAFASLSNCLSDLLEEMSESLRPTVEQYLLFLIGIKKSKPILSKIVKLPSLAVHKFQEKKESSAIHGLDRKDILGVAEQVRKMRKGNAKAVWKKKKKMKVKLDDALSKEMGVEESKMASDLTLDQTQVALDPLLAFFDQNFEVLVEYLYRDVFIHVLNHLWKSIVSTIDKIIDPTQNQEGVRKSSQVQLLYLSFLILKTYFIADGEGLTENDIESSDYRQVMKKMNLFKHSTKKLIYMYLESQADKSHSVESLSKPSLAYEVWAKPEESDSTRARVFVNIVNATNLPVMSSKGSTNAQVHIFIHSSSESKESQLKKTKIVSRDLNPQFNEKVVFSVKELDGLVHCVVYHAGHSGDKFIGEATLSLSSIADYSSADCNHPLVPVPSSLSSAILSVLAARVGDDEAQKFTQLRGGEVLGRMDETEMPASSSSLFRPSKKHQINGHVFASTHYNVPPNCAVCGKLVLGIGKAVYLCGTCGMTCHKACHVRSVKCEISEIDV